MIKSLHHTAISVTDLDRSIQFYRDLLGMTLEWRIDHRRSETLEEVVGLKNVDVSYAMLSGWGGRIELFQYHSPQGEPYPADRPVSDKGITHIAFQVEDIDGLYKKLVSHGVIFNSPPKLIRSGVKVGYFHDPDGVTLEIIQYSS
jgi:catechol 2,3-dioxygenase-like lactoylglutathione lyase family enzyme